MLAHSSVAALMLTVLQFGISQPAIAQEGAVLEEIVVTAQKREQSAQDVGIAIVAIDGESLRERGIDRPQDLFEVMTNVSLQNIGGGGVPVVIVRGVGLQNFRINDSPTTAFYVDDVYQTSIASAEWTMFDLERVELLKGPQGGLYGRNALGGAVQIISNTPEIGGENNGYVLLGFSKFSKAEMEGAAEFALSDNSAIRVAARWVESGDASYEDITLGEKRGEEDRFAARALLRFAPSDTTDVLIKFHAGKDDSQLPPLRPMGIYANIGTGEALGLPGISLGFLNGVLGLGLGDPLCPSVRAGDGMDPANCADISGGTQAGYGIDSDMRSGVSGFEGFQENSWNGASVSLRFDIRDYVLQSITAFDSIDYRRFVDFDGTPVEHQHIDYNSDIDSWSQEFRLFYNGSDTSSWVIGLSYGEDGLEEDSLLLGADGILPPFFGGAVFAPQIYEQETSATAVYGHVEWQVTDIANLVVELRYTDAEKTFEGGSFLGFADGTTVPFVNTPGKLSTDFQAFSGKLGVELSPNENVLWYGNISRGFKTGGFFGGFPTSIDQLDPFDEETVLAYEAGFKADMAEGRVRFNGSVYYYDRSDVQQNAADPNSVIAIKRIANIGDVKAFGVEIDLIWIPTDNLTLRLGLGTADSEVSKSSFVQSSSLPLLPDTSLEGTNTPNYSDLTASFLARYEQPVGDSLDLYLQVDGRHQSASDLSVITDPIEKAVFQEDPYTLFNFRTGLGSGLGTWEVVAFIHNLTDEEYRTTVHNDGTFGVYELYGLPRTWGVRYTYRWE